MSNAAVFDTNILIDFSNGRSEAQDVIRRYPRRLISVVTWIEFLTGVAEFKQEQAKAFLEDMFDIIYPEEDIYDLTLELRRGLRLKLPDAMIYATAKSMKVPLVTRNTKDFDPQSPDIIVPE